MRNVLRVVLGAIAVATVLVATSAHAVSIVDTKHNLSVTGPGPIKAQSETRVCIFCHTPHNANPRTPLWNRAVGSHVYELYASGTIQAEPAQPNGPSRLCLSCHDGTIALGAVIQPAEGIAMTGEIIPGSPSAVGADLNLSGDHPFSFSYYSSVGPGRPVKETPPADLQFYEGGIIECSTCHDPHEDRWRSLDKNGMLSGKFLLAPDRFSEFCLKCHEIENWIGSAHEQSSELVDATKFPVAPRTWPTWLTVAEWGCEICHAPHAAQGTPLLYTDEADVCMPCHGDSPPPGDPHAAALAASSITAQTEKISAHRMSRLPVKAKSLSVTLLLPVGSSSGSVTCSDCHNPHQTTRSDAVVRGPATLAGALKGVSGVDRTGQKVAVASFEYEICFKCHADYGTLTPYIQRVSSTPNTRLEFDSESSSYHPVVFRGKNTTVPSIPSAQKPGLTPSELISCTDCHSDDGNASRGPHGSTYSPILRDRYETSDFTPESSDSYALCYRCHNRDVLLSDSSFQKKTSVQRRSASGGGHSGHLGQGIPCSACHDAHGVVAEPGTGDHTHLINFDLTIVSGYGPNAFPLFKDLGTFSGSCTLTCHGWVHDNEAYPLGITATQVSPPLSGGAVTPLPAGVRSFQPQGAR